MTERPRVVIVGAGFGGLAAARGLARTPVDVTLIDQRNYHLFQPLLYQVATAGLSPADIAWPPPASSPPASPADRRHRHSAIATSAASRRSAAAPR